jgi:GDP-4-dehydro-6-deoxy-D-mannose reductase
MSAGEPSPRVLVTGANGFVGRHLLAQLQETPVTQIFAAVRPEHVEEEREQGTGNREQSPIPDPRPPASVVEIVGLDVCDAEATQALAERARPHQIYHLAARASGADADREAVFAVNVTGTRHLLEAAARLAPKPRVLVVSTGYVYGDTDPARPAREEDPVSLPGRYGLYTDSKIAMEAVAGEYPEFVIVARAFAHTGPGQSPAFAVPAFAQQFARIERGLEPPVLRVGNLETRRDLLDVRDVARAYRLLMAQAAPGEVFNVAIGQPVSLRTVLAQMRGLSPAAVQVTADPARMRPLDIACSTGDPARLQTRTGWRPHYSLETTLRDTLDYWRGTESQGTGERG